MGSKSLDTFLRPYRKAAKQLMHRLVDFGADQLIGKFGFGM